MLEVLEKQRELALRIAPGLRKRPLYVVDLGNGNFPKTDAYGFACSVTSPKLLGAAKWEGPGAMIGLDVDGITEAAAPGFAEACLNATCVHECAHLTPEPEPKVVEWLDSMPANYVETQCDRILAANVEDDDREAEAVHGPRFIRRCCHLWARATAAGYEVHAGDVLGYRGFLSPLWVYLGDFYGEILRMQNATFQEIEELPLPPFTINQFKADLLYRQQHLADESADPNSTEYTI